MPLNFSIQLRSILGEILLFDNVADFFDFFSQNQETTAKISFDDINGIRHRFVMKYTGGVFDKALYDSCKKVFPVGTLIFADIPLCCDEKINQKINRFCELFNVDYYDAYDCICVKNAFTHDGFIDYILDQDVWFTKRKLEQCDCSCCASVVCPTCEPSDLITFAHVSSCGKTCFCYDCECF